MIKAVLFDFGGVLSESGRRGFMTKAVADLYGKRSDEIDLWSLQPNLRSGQRKEDEFFEILNQRHGGHVTPQQFVEKVQGLFKPAVQVYDMAARLRERGIKTAILSNVFSLNAHELQREGCYEGFEPLVLSCYEGFVKPDSRLYEVAVRKLGVKPEQIIYIDDLEECLVPARQQGMHTVLAKTPEQIVADTEALLQKLGTSI